MLLEFAHPPPLCRKISALKWPSPHFQSCRITTALHCAGCDIRLVFKWSTASWNSEFSFQTSCITKAKEPCLPYNLLLAKLDSNYTRMLGAILNKSWWHHPTRHQLYGHLPPITKTIQVRRTRHAGHCWRSRDELISDVLLWTPTLSRTTSSNIHSATNRIRTCEGITHWISIPMGYSLTGSNPIRSAMLCVVAFYSSLFILHSSYVRIRDVALNTCRRRWIIGRSGKRGPGTSVLAAQHDDDDERENR